MAAERDALKATADIHKRHLDVMRAQLYSIHTAEKERY